MNTDIGAFPAATVGRIEGLRHNAGVMTGMQAPVLTDNETYAIPSLLRALNVMHRVIDEGRVTLQELRSSAAPCMSLEEALCGLRQEFMSGNSVQFRVFVTGRPTTLMTELREQVYLIAREAVFNAVRHSGATTIEADVEYSGRRLRLVVRDNGCGMDQQVVRSGLDSHWGLSGMRERAESIGAQLRIWSGLRAGTEVEVSVRLETAAC